MYVHLCLEKVWRNMHYGSTVVDWVVKMQCLNFYLLPFHNFMYLLNFI